MRTGIIGRTTTRRAWGTVAMDDEESFFFFFLFAISFFAHNARHIFMCRRLERERERGGGEGERERGKKEEKENFFAVLYKKKTSTRHPRFTKLKTSNHFLKNFIYFNFFLHQMSRKRGSKKMKQKEQYKTHHNTHTPHTPHTHTTHTHIHAHTYIHTYNPQSPKWQNRT